MRIKFITGLFLLLPFLGFSQGEWNQWRFGDHISLDFNSGNPVQIANNPMDFSNTYTVSLSDSLGNLIFFSDGKTVWDRDNNVMPNGTGLFGTWAPLRLIGGFGDIAASILFRLYHLRHLEDFNFQIGRVPCE
jgi:hypothetical protein